VRYEDLLVKTLKCRPHIVIDDGGDLIGLLAGRCSSYADCLLGGCEETTTVFTAEGPRRPYAPLSHAGVNDAKAKHYYDNKYGTGQSVWSPSCTPPI
jgi:adenosylhomocysteinase